MNTNQTLNAFLAKTDVKSRDVNELKKNDGLVILEGIGTIGATTILVSSGRRSVTINNIYGLGAGAVAVINGGKNGVKEVDEKQEVNGITKPLYEKCMQKSIH